MSYRHVFKEELYMPGVQNFFQKSRSHFKIPDTISGVWNFEVSYSKPQTEDP